MDSDFEANFGISRRTVIKRGAIVGGTLMWAAPAVRTISRAAAADGNGTPLTCTCGGAVVFCFACGTPGQVCQTFTVTCSNLDCFCRCAANGTQTPPEGCTSCDTGTLIPSAPTFCDGPGQPPCPAVPGRCPTI